MSKRRILVVDDETLITESLSKALLRWDYDVTSAMESKQAVERLSRDRFDLVLTDIRMPGMGGMELLQRVKEVSPDTGVVMITAYGTIEQAVSAMKSGAYSYLIKPFDLDKIKQCLEEYFIFQDNSEDIAPKELRASAGPALDLFVGEDMKLRPVYELRDMASRSDAPVLIQSESGTGKELIAAEIHYRSSRKEAPYLKINCAALPEHLIESQLFGHEKGAFTGAVKTSKGLFEEADGGTVLLDEITEMPTHLQAKLLRVLQHGEFTRIGANRPVYSDVRVIATSNRDLDAAIKSGDFREDLYFRLNVLSITIPSLRERKSDILPLCRYFVKKYNAKYGKKVAGVNEDVLEYFRNYHWPGNVREFENVVHRCVLACGDEQRIGKEHFCKTWEKRETARVAMDEDLSLAEMEKHLIRATMERHNGHKTRTAEILGITLKTLRNKMLQYGLESE